MRALLASPLGFLVGLSLGALGGGGSVLAVPALVYAAGQDPRAATATSLLLVGTASLVGVAAHWRAGRVRVGTGVAFGLAGVGGSLGGSALNRHLDPDLLLLGFAVLALVAAWRMLTGCPTCTKVGEDAVVRPSSVSADADVVPADPGPGGTATVVRRWAGRPAGTGPDRSLAAGTAVAVLVAGTAVGFLTGLFGVGGGFVIVPALVLVLRVPMPEAIGTSLLVITVNSAVALAARVSTTGVDWHVTVPFAVAAVAGALTGGKVADRLDANRSLRWFATLLAVVATYTAFRAGASLVE